MISRNLPENRFTLFRIALKPAGPPQIPPLRAEGRPFRQTNQGDARPAAAIASACERARSGPITDTTVGLPRLRLFAPPCPSARGRPRRPEGRRRSGRQAPIPDHKWQALCAAAADALPRIAPASQENIISAAVFMRCRRVISGSGGVCAFERNVHHLAADHARVTGRLRQPRHKLAAHERIAMRFGR